LNKEEHKEYTGRREQEPLAFPLQIRPDHTQSGSSNDLLISLGSKRSE
jgi:hypothetical protein